MAITPGFSARTTGTRAPLKVLYIYKDYAPVVGGIENHIGMLARALATAGHDITVLVCDPGGLAGTEYREGVRIIRAPRIATVLSMPLSIHQPLLAAKQRPDLIHVHSPYPLGEVSGLVARRRSPLVITHHSDVVRQRISLALYAPVLRRVLASADGIIATSPRYRDSSPWLAAVRDRCRVIPLGIDEHRFTPAREPWVGPPTLLMVGKLRHYKGVDILLRALSGLPGVRLRVVGDGPMRGPWETISAELGLTDRVSFIGEADDADLPAFYRRALALVLPSTSRAEAFGTVLLEAMASGLPCITTELGTGTSWVVQDGQTGKVVPPNDADALRAAIADLLVNRERAARLGQAGRRRVEEYFTATAMTEAIEAYYGDLVKNASSRSPNESQGA